jgi:hypothetical protein
MCMSGFTQYHPRPIKTDTQTRSGGATETAADNDPNLFGPRPQPFVWDEPAAPTADSRTVDDAVVSIAGVKTQAAGGVIVELSNGTRLLICPV